MRILQFLRWWKQDGSGSRLVAGYGGHAGRYAATPVAEPGRKVKEEDVAEPDDTYAVLRPRAPIDNYKSD